MIRYHFDLYPRSDPKDGARLVRFTKLQSAEYRGEANGTGSGRFSIRADTAEAQFIDPLGLQYVRVVREDTVAETEAVVGGFFLDSGDFSALDERGTRLLTFGGAGVLSYLARAIIAEETYITDAEGPFDDTWHWYYSTPGAILERMVTEAQEATRPQNPIPDVTCTFDVINDSDGNPWGSLWEHWLFEERVGANLLALLKRLLEHNLYVEMDPDSWELHAWDADTHRRDRTGTEWGTDVIRFQSPTDGTVDTGNIKSDAKRAIAAFIKRSDMLVGNKGVYSWISGTADIDWEGFYPAEDEDGTSHEVIGEAQLSARSDAGDTARLRIKLGTTPTTGHYLPFEHILLDDLVTVHTGSTQWDWDEQNFPVAAITIQLRGGGDWDAWVDLGSSYSATPGRQFQVPNVPAHDHTPNPELCRPGTPGAGITWNTDGTPSARNPTAGYGAELSRDEDLDTFTDPRPFGSAWVKLDYTGAETFDAFRVVQVASRGVQSATGVILQYNNGADQSEASTDWVTAASALFPDGVDTGEVLFSPITSEHWRIINNGVQWTAGLTFSWSVAEWYLGEQGAEGTPGDGHPDLVGTGPRASRCDHKHHVLRETNPTADDDWETDGYPLTTLWTNTVSGASYVLIDATTGAAVWQSLGGASGGDGDDGTDATVPLTPFDQHDVLRGYNLTKQGIVIARGASSSWKESLVESPNVFWSPEAGKYVMVFVGYSGTPASPTEAALGVATADSPDGPWTEYATNPFFEKSGAGDDSHGTSGPFVWYEDETYHLYYIGLTSSGYEAGTKTICHATSTDWIPGTNDGTWTRHGAIIEPEGSGWRDTDIWHPNIVKRGSTYYLFFNAGDGTSESIGYATSTDLAAWTVDDVNSPVLEKGSGTWDDSHVGDPYLYRVGETWYMAYFGFDGTNASDGLAFTSDADFPLGWKKYAGNPVLAYGGSDDSKHAHKPAIWITPTKHYHWYTAVTTASPEKREIALATEEISGVGVDTLDDLSDVTITSAATGDMLRFDGSAWVNTPGRWEVVVSGTAPPVAVSTPDDDDWVYAWVST